MLSSILLLLAFAAVTMGFMPTTNRITRQVDVIIFGTDNPPFETLTQQIRFRSFLVKYSIDA